MARTPSKVVKSIPTTEVIKTTCFTELDESGNKYLITQNPLKQQYTLWKCVDDGFERILVGNNPLEFDDKIPWKIE